MAGVGVQGAYQQVKESEASAFAGEGQLSRIAADNARKKAEERAEQRSIAANARLALQNAANAGNIDFTKIDDSVKGIVGKVLDNYKEKLVDANEMLRQSATHENHMKVMALQNEFTSTISRFKAMGGTVRTLSDNYSQNKYDNIVGVEPMNNMMAFINDLPNMSEKFDPTTNTVDGVSIFDKFKTDVDVSKLVGTIDDEKEIEDYVGMVLEVGQPVETIDKANRQKVTTVTSTYNDGAARSTYKTRFKDRDAQKKISAKLLLERESLEGKELEDFDLKYISKDSSGSPYVSLDNSYDYVRDNYMDKRLVKQTAEAWEPKPMSYSENESLRRQQEKEELAMDRLSIVHELNTTGGTTRLLGGKIYVNNTEAEVKSIKPMPNPFTGKMHPTALYIMKTSTGDVKGRKIYNAENWKEEAARDIDPTFDYVNEAKKYNGIINEPEYVVPSVQLKGSLYGQMADESSKDVESSLSKYDADAPIVTAITSTKTGYIFNKEKGYDTAAAELIRGNLKKGDVNDRFFTYSNKYVSLGNQTYNIEKGDKTLLSKRLATMDLAAKQMKGAGMKDDVIRKELTAIMNTPKDTPVDVNLLSRLLVVHINLQSKILRCSLLINY
jgi:hypothetical protein